MAQQSSIGFGPSNAAWSEEKDWKSPGETDPLRDSCEVGQKEQSSTCNWNSWSVWAYWNIKPTCSIASCFHQKLRSAPSRWATGQRARPRFRKRPSGYFGFQTWQRLKKLQRISKLSASCNEMYIWGMLRCFNMWDNPVSKLDSWHAAVLELCSNDLQMSSWAIDDPTVGHCLQTTAISSGFDLRRKLAIFKQCPAIISPKISDPESPQSGHQSEQSHHHQTSPRFHMLKAYNRHDTTPPSGSKATFNRERPRQCVSIMRSWRRRVCYFVAVVWERDTQSHSARITTVCVINWTSMHNKQKRDKARQALCTFTTHAHCQVFKSRISQHWFSASSALFL